MTDISERLIGVGVNVGGSALPEPWMSALEDMRVVLDLDQPAQLTLRFGNPELFTANNTPFAFETKIEAELITVTPSGSAFHDVVFKGEVTSVAFDQRSDRQAVLLVTALDPSHRLSLNLKARSFLNMSYDDVVGKIASENGLSKKGTSKGAAKVRHPYLAQDGTDFALLNEISRRAGYEWWVEDTQLSWVEAGTRQGAAVPVRFGEDLYRFKVRTSATERSNEVAVRGWDPTKQQAVVGKATSTDQLAAMKKPVSSGGRPSNLSITNRHVRTVDEAKGLAQTVKNRIAQNQVTGRGEAVFNAKLRPGVHVKVEDAGNFSGTYQLTRVEHIYRGADLPFTRFEVGVPGGAGLVGVLRDVRPEHGQFAALGLVVGVVTNIQDPDQGGRVKVKFPWASQEDESAWARVLSIGAGPNMGHMVIPEIDDEVLVGFEHGDHRYPVVLGGLWSAKNKPPMRSAVAVKQGKVVNRSTFSRTGHVIEVTDETAPKDDGVTIKLKNAAHKLRLGMDRADLAMPAGKPISIKSGTAEVTIAQNGDITISGNNINIEAKQNVSIEGLQVAIKGQTGLQAQAGGAKLDLKPAAAELNGAGMLGLKGGLVKIN